MVALGKIHESRLIMNFEKFLRPTDVVKFCFQAAFGAEHAISDIKKTKEYFYEEYNSTPADNENLFEEISPEVIRVNFSAWKMSNLNPEWLLNMFVNSRQVFADKNAASKQFSDLITEFDKYVRDGLLPFTYDEWKLFMDEYSKKGEPYAVRHSEDYRNKFKPAYRLVTGHQFRILPLLKKLSGFTQGVISIDGRSASGKSTMAESLKKVMGASVIKMDDFFLPPELRTNERLKEAGGNVHYERFISEILPIEPNTEIKYRPFCCQTMDYKAGLTIPPSPWIIVEGAYSHHPKFNNYSDLKVFSDISPDNQLKRIKIRNGEEVAKIYSEKWIPLEENYIKSFNVKENADLII